MNRGDERAWVEVDLDALRANFRMVRERVGGGAALIPMVKADGYGLGAARVVRALDPLDPWGYGVATATEGRALRADGVTRPVLVFSPLPPQHVALAADAGLTASVSDLDALERWALAARRLDRPLDFHVEIDTGMGRAGFDWRETSRWAPRVKALAGMDVRWAGVYTHFHGADAPDRAPTDTQWRRFQDALAQLPVSREDLLVHGCNSAAALRFPEYGGDLVRPGIYLYGCDPAHETAAGYPLPRSVASLRARIVLVRDVPPGTTVGYGATHAARGWARWATLAIGYGDGLPRALGNIGAAIVRGVRVPIVGRVSMDMTVVDVSEVPAVEAGDVATLLGRDGGEEIRLEHVAAQATTIGYEILTRLTTRLPRLEVDGGRAGA